MLSARHCLDGQAKILDGGARGQQTFGAVGGTARIIGGQLPFTRFEIVKGQLRRTREVPGTAEQFETEDRLAGVMYEAVESWEFLSRVMKELRVAGDIVGQRVLASLANLSNSNAVSVRGLAESAGLSRSSVHRALMRIRSISGDFLGQIGV